MCHEGYDRGSLPIEQRVDMDHNFYLASGATLIYIAARALRNFALKRGPQLPLRVLARFHVFGPLILEFLKLLAVNN